MSEQPKRKRGLGNIFGTAKEVMYGMASHDMSRHALRTRASMEHLFILITMGDLLGVPILPPYYSPRLMPYVLAKQGHRVLVFSVDPQASLSDIFQRDIFGKGPVKIMDNLWAQEIDADGHIRAYQQQIRQKILDMYGLDKVPEEIDNYIEAASAEP